jgi:hypothetical protein
MAAVELVALSNRDGERSKGGGTRASSGSYILTLRFVVPLRNWTAEMYGGFEMKMSHSQFCPGFGGSGRYEDSNDGIEGSRSTIFGTAAPDVST